MENVKDTKEAKTRVVLINQIIDRAAELGIMYSSRLSHSMDINYAVQVFDIDLKAWLDSTNNDFIHDYVGKSCLTCHKCYVKSKIKYINEKLK